MDRLHTELQRLYLAAPGGTRDERSGSEVGVRALVLGLKRPADWGVLSRVWQGVQADLEWPAPAIAVCGSEGLQLWFSLSQAVPLAQAQALLDGLRLRYLNDITPTRITQAPAMDPLAPDQVRHATPVPAPLPEAGRWSAFVSADLAAVFNEDPWLDLPPGPDNQADLLSRVRSVAADEIDSALARLAPASAPASAAPTSETAAPDAAPAPAAPQDPRGFLLSVMNDPQAPLALRVDAAKALLSGSTPV